MLSKAGLLALCVAVAACQSTPVEVAAPAPLSCPPPPEPVACPEPMVCPEPVACPPAAAQVCPPPPPPPACPKPKLRSGEVDGKLIVGEVEFFNVQPGDLRLEARIDTGATTSSLHATDIEVFERDGDRWVRFKAGPHNGEKVQLELPWVRRVKIKEQGYEYDVRPVVLVEVALNGHRRQIEVTLNDRSNYQYELLIGRNFLRDNCIVDVSRKHVLGRQ
jgi:hypothetical protein